MPLLFLGLVVVGGAVVLRSMMRLKRAAVAALEAARDLDDRLQSLQAQTESLQAQAQAQADEPSPRPDGPSSS